MEKLYYIDKADFNRIIHSSLSPINKAYIFSLLCRINTLYMIQYAGSGHIGTSFSSMDIFSHLYINVLKDKDIFFSSKGHDVPGLYAVLMGLGKLDYNYIHKLRRLNGLPGHPDINTPCIKTNTGSLGMGISKAKGMILANRLNGRSDRVYVLTGDGELQEGQFWESLQGAVNNKLWELVVIIDHNKIQSDTWVENVSSLGKLDIKLESYGWNVKRCNGNSHKELSDVFKFDEMDLDQNSPTIIIADTIKGCGVSFLESTSIPQGEKFYKFHSGALDYQNYKKASEELIEKANDWLVNHNFLPLKVNVKHKNESNKGNKSNTNKQRLISSYEQILVNTAKNKEELVVLDADLMIDCGLLNFQEKFPNRFIECGIAEQDMVSMAGGLALLGKIPVVHSFACFLTSRANEQIFNNATEGTKCIYVGSLAGILPAGPGHSHQMVRDISILSSTDNLILLEPSCEAEVQMVFEYAVYKNPKSTYIRLVSIPYNIPFSLSPDYILEEGKGNILFNGDDAVIFSYGPVMLSEAYEAANILKNKYGFSLKVVNLPWLNKIDKEWLAMTINGIKKVFTLDNHMLSGGQGEMIGSAIAEIGLSDRINFKRRGLESFPTCGQNEEVLAFHGLDRDSIVKFVLE